MANGILKVGEITTSSGSGNITIGSGVTLKSNVPAFEAYLSSNQTISHNTATKVQFDIENSDTDNTYDNSTNYRFTPGVAGTYYIYSGINLINASNELQKARAIIYKNGSEYRRVDNDGGSSGTEETMNETVSAIMTLTATDFIEIYTLIFQDSGTTNVTGASYQASYFGAYKIGA